MKLVSASILDSVHPPPMILAHFMRCWTTMILGIAACFRYLARVRAMVGGRAVLRTVARKRFTLF